MRKERIFTVPDLPYFGPHNLCNACPACHSDHGRNRNHIGFSRSGQKKNDKKKIRHRQKDLGQPHQKCVQPRRCTSADCAEENGNHSGNQRRKQTDRQRYSAAVPDHRENISSHRIGSKQKFPARHDGTVFQIHIRRILRHDLPTEKAAQHKKTQKKLCCHRPVLIPFFLFFCFCFFCRPLSCKLK